MFHTEVVVLKIDIEVRQDERVLNKLPDNTSHLIAIELYNGSCNFNLAHHHPLPIVCQS